jgi:hypothetical protein
VQAIVKWLDVGPVSDEEWEIALQQKANRGHSKNPSIDGCAGKTPEMLPETSTMLQTFYQPWNKILAQQLGAALSWEYSG